MKITEELFEAFLHCKTKSYLISRQETGALSEIKDWIVEKHTSYRKKALKYLASRGHQRMHGLYSSDDIFKHRRIQSGLAENVTCGDSSMESKIQALEISISGKNPQRSKIVSLRFFADRGPEGKGEKVYAKAPVRGKQAVWPGRGWA